jgi:hypothetical protein
MQIRWNTSHSCAELIHDDGRAVLVPESKLILLDGSMAALIHEARLCPAQSVRVPSFSNARGLTRRTYHNALTN